MSTGIEKHKNFQKYKDHPLVVFLLEEFYKTSASGIPERWVEFIKASTEHTDMSLLASQLPTWIPNNSIDLNLRGEELMQEIRSIRLLKQLLTADVLTTPTTFWPCMLERALIETHQIPRKETATYMGHGGIQTQLDVFFIERGTIEYSIERMVPRQEFIIPAEWILKFCGPKRSDSDVFQSYLIGPSTGFEAEGLPKGYKLLDWLKNKLGIPRKINLGKLSGDHSHFPQTLNIRTSQSGRQETLQFGTPQPEEMSTTTRIENASLQFRTPKTPRGADSDFSFRYPVFSSEARTAALLDVENRDIEPPQSSQVLVDGYAHAEGKTQLVRALRAAYTGIKEGGDFARRRAEIQEIMENSPK